MIQSRMSCHLLLYAQLLAPLDSLVGRKVSARGKGSTKSMRVQKASERRRATQAEMKQMLSRIEKASSESQRPVYLVIHSIDSLTLRAAAWRTVLGRVASCEWVRLIASADTISSPACELLHTMHRPSPSCLLPLLLLLGPFAWTLWVGVEGERGHTALASSIRLADEFAWVCKGTFLPLTLTLDDKQS